MLSFPVGVALGLALGIVATYLVLRAQRAVTPSISKEALADLKDTAPDLLDVVESAPAVPVQDQPAEVTSQSIAPILEAKDLETAQAVARSLIPNQEVADAVALLGRWTPRRHTAEDKYQSSFRSVATKNGYAGRIDEKPKVLWGENSDRTAYPDFVIGDPKDDSKRVLVELKANLTSSSDADRALGQMLRYLLAWKKKGPAILVVCGEASPDIRFLIRMYIKTWRETVGLPVTVYFKRDDVVPAGELALMPTSEEV